MKFTQLVLTAGLAMTVNAEQLRSRTLQGPPLASIPEGAAKQQRPGQGTKRQNGPNTMQKEVPMYDWINGSDDDFVPKTGGGYPKSGNGRPVPGSSSTVGGAPQIVSDTGRAVIRRRPGGGKRPVKEEDVLMTPVEEEEEDVLMTPVEEEEPFNPPNIKTTPTSPGIPTEAHEVARIPSRPVEHTPITTGTEWYEFDTGAYQNPHNIRFINDNAFEIDIVEGEGNAKLHTKEFFTGGRFSIKMKTASSMPGVITAFYLASGDGRVSDEAVGTQDELDFEVKGNTPDTVQTNVFMAGEEAYELHTIGDTSAESNIYTFDWSDERVIFEINGEVVRESHIERPLKPMQMAISIWTTYNLWPGVIEWAGEADWSGTDKITAEFEVLEFPTKAEL